MYNAYFGFKEAPFSIAPDPRYLYMTGQHREALAHLVYGLNSEGGCILLTGEVGTGKTTVCRCLLEQIPEQAHIALVLNPKVTATELLETICDELKIQYPAQGNTVKTYIDLINRFLIEANARNEKTVLIIDEAQNLDSTVLEQLRLLTNLETNQRKLLQIIILGQPELLEILARKEMRQLAQRITARFHLNALTRSEVKAYVTHRLAVAGQNVQLFPEHTIRQLYRLSKGVPRLINILCDRALLGTYVQNKQSVDKLTLNTASKEVFGELRSVETRKKWANWPRISIIVSVLFILALLLLLLVNREQNPVFNQQEAAVGTVVQTAPIQPVLPVITEQPSQVVTEPAENITDNEVPASDDINEFVLTVDGNDLEQAFTVLFGIWERDYPGAGISACSHAQTIAMSCLHASGNLYSLRKLNRPAILKLYNEESSNAYLVISQLKNDIATINTGDSRFKVDTTQLEKYWYGEYILLWQTPPFYNDVIQPGSSGPVVQWLDQQLTRLYGQEATPTIRDTYSDDLVNLVKKFQQSKGLIPDGVVGPLTLIHLNSAIGIPTPDLITNNEQEI